MRGILGRGPHGTIFPVTTDLADRYGSPRGWQRPVVVGASAVLVVAFLGWLAWATWFHASPAVRSEFISSRIVDAHTATAVVDIALDKDAEKPLCRIRALAEDHNVVGELPFVPVDGRNEVTITTEREATAVDLIGCTAEGQPRAQ